MSKKLTIILPVFNNIETLDDTLSSILDQTVKNFDVIIIDDNSTDGSSKILKNYAQKHDFFYKKIFTDYDSKILNGINVDTGTSACNEALKHATSDWIVTIGDEILLKNSVEIILNIINQYSYDHIILDVLNIKKSENSKIRKKKFDFEKFKKNEGLKLISKERLLKFTHSQIGMMNKYFPQFSSNLNFNIKNNFFLRKFFFKSFKPLPGNAGGSLINKRVYKNINYNYLNQRIFPSFNGRGADRDYNFRIINKFKNSVQISLPILPSNMDHEVDNEFLKNYLKD